MRRHHACLLIGALVGQATVGAAQRFSPEVAIGIVAPIGLLGARRGIGPTVGAGFMIGGPDRRVRLRIGFDVATMPGHNQPGQLGAAGADLRLATLGAAVLMGPRRGRLAPYLVLGVESHSMEARGYTNPYGRVGGLSAGVGLRASLRRLEARAEVTAHLILSDFATGEDFAPGTYVPVTLRVAF